MAGFDESGFLDLLYGAAITPRLWEPVLERLSDMVGGASSSLSRFDLTTGVGPGVYARADPELLATYYSHYAAVNPLHNVSDVAAYRRNWRARILTDEDWIEKSDFVKTEYYNGYFVPQKRHSVMMVRLALEGNAPSVINIVRPIGRDQFGSSEFEAMERLHGHLIRAFTLGRQLEAGRNQSESAAVLFDRSPHGVFLLDDEGRLLRASPAGEAMLRGKGAMTVVGGRLTARATASARRLAALLAAAGDAGPERRGGSMVVPAPGRNPGLSVTVAPMKVEEECLFGGRPKILVCVTDPQSDVSLPPETLKHLFGLTRSEARLAIALFSGDSLSEAADRLGIKRNTARVHLASVFEKTGVNRQGALIALMTRCVGPGFGGAEVRSPN